MNATRPVPGWLLLPLPANADPDPQLLARVEEACGRLPGKFPDLTKLLDGVRAFASYEPAVNRANAIVWAKLDALLAAGGPERAGLVNYAAAHMPPRLQARILRRLAKDPDMGVRAAVRKVLEAGRLKEVSLPQTKDGRWDATGWMLTPTQSKVTRHKTGKRLQEKCGVPPVANLKQLRELLGVKSPAQLGFFLLATEKKKGPYTTRTIPKRGGGDRLICAPKKQLKWVQRQILKHILAKVPAHPAAHGFVNGRSTVSNAERHVGADLIVKFDLKDFFPTVHYFRVMGLFASLGYNTGNCLFGTDDDAKQVAPVLARLCCYTPDPAAWGTAALPQGAPTSPAISNLVCRRLDARLQGLAERNGGTYTRYADDLTFSFKLPEDAAPFKLGRFRWWVDQVCQQEGFAVNHDKFRVIRDSQRQVVTGIVVNDAVRVPRELRRRFRAMLHNCVEHGVESQAKGNPRFKEYLRGFAAYLHMVQPAEGAAVLRQVNELLLGPVEGDATGGEA